MKGKQLRNAREHAHLTQVELAKRIGLNQSRISQLEHDARNINYIRVETLQKLCEALHLTPNDLMGYPTAV